MFKRLFCLLGLLFGAFSFFHLRLPKPHPHSAASLDLGELVTDALLLCDSMGKVAEANAPAQALFGPGRLPALHYLTGQAVPPGQHPLRQAVVSRKAAAGLYGCMAADGSARVLEVSARPLPDGGAAAVFRDVTAQHENKERERAMQARQVVVQTLCRRLSLAQTAEAMGQAVAEETAALLREWPDVQVKLFVFDPASDTLTCLAAAPDGRPKWPRSAAEAGPQTIRFDAHVPELWQMYVARKPSTAGLPLISGGVAIGHLSVTSADVFGDLAVRETLELIASLAALALAGAAASAQAASSAALTAAVREIAAAVSLGTTSELADRVGECVKRVTDAEICTLSVPMGGKLCVMGEAYKDDLLTPQTAPNDPRLQSKATRKAWRTQKSVTHLGLPPAGEAGPWRAFAGRAGLHSVVALPLGAGRGVLTVYTQGDKPLPEAQKKFLETAAALLALSPAAAATPSEARAD